MIHQIRNAFAPIVSIKISKDFAFHAWFHISGINQVQNVSNALQTRYMIPYHKSVFALNRNPTSTIKIYVLHVINRIYGAPYIKHVLPAHMALFYKRKLFIVYAQLKLHT